MNLLRPFADRYYVNRNTKLHHQVAFLKDRVGNEVAKSLRLQRQIADLNRDAGVHEKTLAELNTTLEMLHEQNAAVDALHEGQLVKRDNENARLDIENNTLRAKQLAMAEAHAAGTAQLHATIAQLRRQLEEATATWPAPKGPHMCVYPDGA